MDDRQPEEDASDDEHTDLRGPDRPPAWVSKARLGLPPNKRFAPTDVALLLVLPLVCLMVAGAFDYFVLQEMGITLSL